MSATHLSNAGLLAGVADWYTRSLEQHGLIPMGVGWRNAEQQQLRFDKLAAILAGDDSAALTVTDWGCGFASMYDDLERRLGPRLAEYHGHDISEKMLAAARQRVTDPRAVFIGSDLVEQESDYTFVSGTFNVRLQSPEETWKRYVMETLMKLSAVSRKGIAFNILSTHVDWKNPDLFYADPCEFFDFSRRNLSKRVSLFHDYPLHEWTILVKKSE